MKGTQAPLIHPPGRGLNSGVEAPSYFRYSSVPLCPFTTRVTRSSLIRDTSATAPVPDAEHPRQRIGGAAGLIGIATLTSRVLGLVRDQVQAAYFGTGPAADAFVVATRIPTLLRDLFAEGAMSAAFVPTLTRTLTRDGKDAAWRLASRSSTACCWSRRARRCWASCSPNR